MKSRSRIFFLIAILFCLAILPAPGAHAAARSAVPPKTSDQCLLNLSAAARTGWQYLDGKWYYFDSNGVKKTGWQQIGGKWYYLSRWDNGAMLTGSHTLDGKTYLFDSSGAMATGWKKVDGKWYYANSSGYVQMGWQKIGGKWYYLSRWDNGAMLTGSHTLDGKTYLFDSSGAMATGWKAVGGKWYYANSSGHVQMGWQKIGGKWYYLSRWDNGAMLTGSHTLDGKTYLFDSSGAMATGWKSVNGKWYYANSSGHVQMGWQKIGGKWYYLSPWDNGAMLTGWQELDGQTYCFTPSGDMVTGWKKVDGNWYYMNSSGHRLTRWQEIDGSWYYLSPWDNGAMLTGWQKLDSKWYYFTPSGDMVTGFRIIEEKAYYFGSDGAMQEDWASKNVIVIDPGHSSEIPDWQVPLGPGSDEMKDADNSGTVSITNGLHEYELVLDISLRLRDKLEARGYKVVMVRTTNSGVYSCVDRAKVANDNNAAVFLRVHANAAPKDHSKNGAMTICITEDNEFIPQMYQKSRLLSDLILSNYVRAVGCYNEGVWERDDMIANNWSKVPTTLVELGYMTNSREDQLMQTAAYQEKMVTGLLNGIDAYFKATAK